MFKVLAYLALAVILSSGLRSQTTALEAWQTDRLGDDLDQLDSFVRSGGSKDNGRILSSASAGDMVLSVTSDQTLHSRSTLALPAASSAVPVVAAHGRISLYGVSGSAGIGVSDSASPHTWYYLLLNGTHVILRRSNAGSESNVGAWPFSPGESAADIRFVADYSISGRITFTVRYGLVGSPLATQVATDPIALEFTSGRLRSAIHVRGGRLAEFALATRVIEPPPEPPSISFPVSANSINVKLPPYNAVGNGTTDDTAAIQAAITDAVGSAQGMRTIYFPNGTYLISKRLEWKSRAGQWENYLTLQGESRSGTIIRLRDNSNSASDNFTEPANPRAVIFTASELNTPSPTSGGKDYTNLGEGNAAFGNSIFNLTIDTGTGNHGAIAVDFLTNNSGTLKSVTLRSSDGQGVAGLGLIRRWTGPLLVKDVLIDGFTTGILTQNSNYSATLEHVTLRNQSAYGIDNQAGIVLAIRGLVFRSTSTSAVGIRNNGQGGLVTLLDSSFFGANSNATAIESSSGAGAPPNHAALYARTVITDGFAAALRQNAATIAGTVTDEYVSGGVRSKFTDSALSSLHLPVEETPVFFEPDFSQWVNVQDFGANPDDNTDDAPAIQAAIDSTAVGQTNAGKTILHFPQGLNATSRYLIGTTVALRHAIRKIEGNFSRLSATGVFFEDWNFTNPVLRISTGAASNPVFIERVEFRAENLTVTPISVEHDTARTLVVKHTDLNGLRTTFNAGKLFIEDVTAHTLTSLFRFEGPAPVYARQLNPEDLYNTKVRVIGTSLWCLGFKTERPSPVLHAAGGARVEILGGLLHNSVHPSPESLPAIRVENAAVTLSAATVGSSALHYDVDVRESRSGVTLDQSLADSPDRPGYTSFSSLLPLFSAWDGYGVPSLPSVSVAATVPYAAEPSTAGHFTFSRSGDTSADLTVKYTVSGAALNGEDYITLPGAVTIPAGARTITVAITPLDDTITEHPESITLSVASASAYNPGWPTEATVSISDNDVVTGAPPGTNLVMWLRADAGVVADPSGGLLAWRDQAGNANHAINDESLRRPLWKSGVPDQFVSQPQVAFRNRSFILLQPSATLQRSPTGYTAKTHAVYFRTGADVTTRQVIWEQGSDGRGLNLYLDGGNLYAGAWSAPASGGWRVFRSNPVSANTEYLATLVFDASTQSVTAFLDGEPFSGLGSADGTVTTIPAQGDESTLGGMISKTLFHDGPSGLSGHYFSGAIAEVFSWNAALLPSERVNLQTYISSKYSPALVFASLAATVPAASESPYAEGSFTVTRTGSTTSPLTLEYAISGTATNGADYQPLTGTITLEPGVSGAPIVIKPVQDADAEFEETVTLTLRSGHGYTLTGTTTGTVTITQDIVRPFSINQAIAPSATTVIPITIANPSASSATTFTLGIPTDYTAVRSDSNASNRPPVIWQDIVNNNTGTIVFTAASADQNTPTGAIPLGFSFPYFGKTYDSVHISPDGWISFTSNLPVANHYDLSNGSTLAPPALLAPFWTDLIYNHQYAKVAYRQLDGNTFVIEWLNAVRAAGGFTPQFAVLLKSDGTIYFNYTPYSGVALNLFAIGLQNEERTSGMRLAYNSTPPYLPNSPLTIRIDPPPAWLSIASTTVIAPPGGTATLDLLLSSIGVPPGERRDLTLPIFSSIPGSPPLQIPVTMHSQIAAPPTIVATPTSGSVVTGTSATFAVSATGSGPLSYQWQTRPDPNAVWSNISGSNSESYTTGPLSLADSGRSFRCIVTNASGSVTSDFATITVTLPASAIARVVNWDGDYVNANQVLQGIQSVANGDWNLDSIALDQRRWIPFSLTTPIEPAVGYTSAAGFTKQFTGGVLVERYGTLNGTQQTVNPFTSSSVGVLNSATDDRIRLGSDTVGEWVWGVVLFHSRDFLASTGFEDTIALDANSRLTLTIASARNAQARFVVLSRGTTYVSAPFTTSQTNVAPTSLSWFSWTFNEGNNAAAIGTLKIQNPPRASAPDFSDVTAVGFTVQPVLAVEPAVDRSSLNVSAFLADFVVSPGPANFADWSVYVGLPPNLRTASADPDADGLPNLLEYALGSDPVFPDGSIHAPSLDLNADRLELTFMRARDQLFYTVEVSDDLLNWTAIATNPGQSRKRVTVYDTTSIGPLNPRRFMRLRVSSN